MEKQMTLLISAEEILAMVENFPTARDGWILEDARLMFEGDRASHLEVSLSKPLNLEISGS